MKQEKKVQTQEDTPLDLDKWSRNERLYKSLISKGLWVEPVYDEMQGIEYLKVSVGKI